ncbi:MAG: SHOCT domain-containing protein [Nitrososphaerota archaeon]
MSEDVRRKIISLLRKMEELRESGELSQEEYEEKKRQLIQKLRELENSETSLRRADHFRTIMAVLAASFILLGIIITLSYSVVIPKTSQGIIATTFTRVTTLSGTLLEESSSYLERNHILVIEMSSVKLLNWPPISGTLIVRMPTVKGAIATYPGTETKIYQPFISATTTVMFLPSDFLFQVGDKYYRALTDTPTIQGYISSSQPVDFLILDLDNYLKFVENREYDTIYSVRNIVGVKNIEFIPSLELLMPLIKEGGPVRLVFINRGDEPTTIRYKLDAIWEAIEMTPLTNYLTTITQITTFPYIWIGIPIIFLGLLTLMITFMLRKRR